MKSIFKLAMCATITFVALEGSAGAPPSVMVLPDNTWAKSNGFMDEVAVGGRTRKVVRYADAFDGNSDLKNCVAELNSLLQSYNLPPKDFVAQANADDDEDAIEEMYTDKQGNTTQSTTFDDILNKAKPDLLLYIGWNKNGTTFNYSISYRLEAIDSYSNKSVATVTGESGVVASTQNIGAVLKNSANDHMAEFAAKLQSYFDNVQANGREIRMDCRIKDGAGVDFDSDFNGETLSTLIYNWLEDNTVNHSFQERTSTPNRLVYDQTRIPLKDARGRSMQARQFAENLAKYLRSTCGINVENRSSGLGRARIYITD